VTESWIVPLAVVLLTQTAAIATSVYLHRALAHRSLTVHPAADLLLRTLLWLTTGLLLANFGKEGRPEPVVPKISQATLAEMVGATRSRISHFMNTFRKLGFVKYNGGLEVHSSLLHVVLHD
jgi:hypothetical protein